MGAARATALPVVLTALGVALAMLPFVVRGTIAGTEILRPFALVVIGGLVTSTLYSLLILPALYLQLVAPKPDLGAATPQKERTP